MAGVLTRTLNFPANEFVTANVDTVDGSAWTWSAGPTQDNDQFLAASRAVLFASASAMRASQQGSVVAADQWLRQIGATSNVAQCAYL